MTTDHDDPLLTARAVARRLGVTTETVRRWMRAGDIDYVEIGPKRLKRVRQSVVARLYVERRSTPRPECST